MANLKTHYENGSFVIEFYASSILNQSEVESIGNELLLIASKSACSRVVVDLENVDLLVVCHDWCLHPFQDEAEKERL